MPSQEPNHISSLMVMACFSFIKSSGKYWRFKYRFAGKEKSLALGVYPDVNLAEARERRIQARKVLTAGNDPGEVKKEAKRLRTCSRSFEQEGEESQDCHVERGIEFSFAVFPESSAFFKPGEGAFDDPAFGDNSKGVEFVAFGNFDGSAKDSLHCFGERLPSIAAVHQDVLHLRQIFLSAVKKLRRLRRDPLCLR